MNNICIDDYYESQPQVNKKYCLIGKLRSISLGVNTSFYCTEKNESPTEHLTVLPV